MNGFQAYAIILAVVMTDPATIGAAGRLWMRFRGIRRAAPPPRGVLIGHFSRALEQKGNPDKNVSVRTASTMAGKVQTNETA